MSRLKAANNAQTALAALMDATATTCTVVSGDILPAVPFRASIDNEIIEVGAKSGNDLSSILRGQEGTTAAAHQSGSLVEARMTAGMHNELLASGDSITISQSTAPTGNTGTVSNILGYLANRIKAITGKTNWYDAPSKTLEDVKTHIDALVTNETVHGLKIEEGAFTPYVFGSTTAGTGLTYSTQTGKYYKIGKRVHVEIVIVMTAKGTDIAGYVRIGGLPFSISGNNPSAAIGFTYNIGLASGTMFAGWGASTYIALNELGNNVGLNLSVDRLQNSSQIYITMDYLAAS